MKVRGHRWNAELLGENDVRQTNIEKTREGGIGTRKKKGEEGR